MCDSPVGGGDDNGIAVCVEINTEIIGSATESKVDSHSTVVIKIHVCCQSERGQRG